MARTQKSANEIQNILPDCRWTLHHKNVIVLLNRQHAPLLTEKETEQLSHFLRGSNLSLGMSDCFDNILETPKYYRQAARAVELGLFTTKGENIFKYSDYVFCYIAQVISKKNDLQDFCHPASLFLQKYDAENGTSLIDTLDKYLIHVNDPVAAAEALFIHRNTLLYRINKIKELTGLDLNNGDTRLKVQLSLKFLQFQKGIGG
jgi:DNA-binding PucR family transcriptional regulator